MTRDSGELDCVAERCLGVWVYKVARNASQVFGLTNTPRHHGTQSHLLFLSFEGLRGSLDCIRNFPIATYKWRVAQRQFLQPRRQEDGSPSGNQLGCGGSKMVCSNDPSGAKKIVNFSSSSEGSKIFSASIRGMLEKASSKREEDASQYLKYMKH